MSDATTPSLSDLYAALVQTNTNSLLIAHEIDAAYGTQLAGQFPTLPPTPPTPGIGIVPAGPVYGTNGATAPDADGCVQLKVVEDFRAANAASTSAQVRNLCASMPHRWFIQDTLDALTAQGVQPSDPTFFQIQANCGEARTLLSMLDGVSRNWNVPAYKATPSMLGLWTRGDVLPDAGSFAGKFVIAGITVFKGVYITDVAAILAAQLQRALKNPTQNNQ